MALIMNSGGNQAMVEATEKLWLTADKDELVPDGDERAAFLFCTPGMRVSKADAERYGMVKPAAKQQEPAEDKQADTPADKQVAAPANKQPRGPRADK